MLVERSTARATSAGVAGSAMREDISASARPGVSISAVVVDGAGEDTSSLLEARRDPVSLMLRFVRS